MSGAGRRREGTRRGTSMVHFPPSLAINDFFGSSYFSSLAAAPRLTLLPGPWAPVPQSPPFISPVRGHAC